MRKPSKLASFDIRLIPKKPPARHSTTAADKRLGFKLAKPRASNSPTVCLAAKRVRGKLSPALRFFGYRLRWLTEAASYQLPDGAPE